MNWETHTRVLGNWQPSKHPSRLDLSDFQTEFQAKIQRLLGVRPGSYIIEIRHPTVSLNASIHTFHQDGLPEPKEGYAVMWSNVYPTEIRYLHSLQPLETHPGDIIFINDSEVEHRAPRYPDDAQRWFVRSWIYDHPRR